MTMMRVCLKCGVVYEGDPGSVSCPACAEKQRRNTIKPRTCRRCGAQFLGGGRAWYCPDCRTIRRRELDQQHLARARAGLARKLGDEYPCEVCGKMYICTGGKQKYCPDCAPETVAEIRRQQARDWYAKHGDPDKRREQRQEATAPIICVICGKPYKPDTSAMTCSPECSREYRRRYMQDYDKAHKERNKAKCAAVRAKIKALPPEEQKTIREQINARERENYRKRKAAAKK